MDHTRPSPSNGVCDVIHHARPPLTRSRRQRWVVGHPRRRRLRNPQSGGVGGDGGSINHRRFATLPLLHRIVALPSAPRRPLRRRTARIQTTSANLLGNLMLTDTGFYINSHSSDYAKRCCDGRLRAHTVKNKNISPRVQRRCDHIKPKPDPVFVACDGYNSDATAVRFHFDLRLHHDLSCIRV